MGWVGAIADRVRAVFSVPAGPIDALVANMVTATGPVSREDAMSVAAVTKGRNLICSIATLPLVQRAPDLTCVDNPLLQQIDRDIANVVALAQTIEDLLFDGIAWWRIVETDYYGWPTKVRRVVPANVFTQWPTGRMPAPLPSGIDPREGVVYIEGERFMTPSREIIRFDSPNPPLLRVAATTIRRAMALDGAAKTYADNPTPGEYFTDAPNVKPASTEEVKGFLARWRAARRKGSVAYVPPEYQYNAVTSVSPRDLQLVELQRQVGLELANFFGVDPEDLGISTTSRTYSNDVDRRHEKINDVLAAYMLAITGRLSMGDVTPRGHKVKFDLADYLKSNPTERASVQKTYIDMGVYDAAYVRNVLEEIPGAPPAKPTPPPAPPVGVGVAPAGGQPTDMPMEEPAMAATRGPVRATFSQSPVTLRFVTPEAGHAFEVDSDARTITGLLVPYDAQAKGIRFAPGALQIPAEASDAKLNIDHNWEGDNLVGVLKSTKETRAGLMATFSVPNTPEGDRALAKASGRIYHALSAEVDFDDRVDAVPDPLPRYKGGLLVNRADLRGAALTGRPAFTGARLTTVNMTEGEKVEPCPTCGQVHAAGAACPTPATPPAPAPASVTLTTEQFNTLVAAARPAAPAGPEPVNANNGGRTVAVTHVTDPASYRFDTRGQLHAAAYDFGMDLITSAKAGGREDMPETRRALAFMREQFDIVPANVASLNPTMYLPRFIDQREFQYPLWSRINRGAPPNGMQGFTWPQFATGAGLVGNHTTGTEPTSGTYTTSQATTVVPTPVSGKAKIAREVWDMGGQPGMSGILWNKIQRDWYEALESFAVAGLGTAAPASLATFTIGGGANKATLVAEMRAALAGLQFVRGGFRFDTALAQVDLYAALAAATDTTGRPIFPQISPMNADGTTASQYARIDVGGTPFIPEWALAASGSVAANSYLIDSTAVDGWATPPQRIDIVNTEIANVYVGVWGYKAFAVNDAAGARTISYDPV